MCLCVLSLVVEKRVAGWHRGYHAQLLHHCQHRTMSGEGGGTEDEVSGRQTQPTACASYNSCSASEPVCVCVCQGFMSLEWRKKILAPAERHRNSTGWKKNQSLPVFRTVSNICLCLPCLCGIELLLRYSRFSNSLLLTISTALVILRSKVSFNTCWMFIIYFLCRPWL